LVRAFKKYFYKKTGKFFAGFYFINNAVIDQLATIYYFFSA